VEITGQETRFRAMFAEEAEGRLAALSELQLELERSGGDPELLSSVFREVHTLKGAAAVVGLDDVLRVAHAMEEVLDGLRSGGGAATPAVVDALDGVGDDEAIYAIFRSGLSTAATVSEVSGRGVGLDVVRTSLAAVRGRVEVHSEPGAGSEFRLSVPITLALLPCLLVTAAGRRFAIPMHSVVSAEAAGFTEDHVEGQVVIRVRDQILPVSGLATTLGLGEAPAGDQPALVVASMTRRHAFRVDALLGQRNVVVKDLGGSCPGWSCWPGPAWSPTGRSCSCSTPPAWSTGPAGSARPRANGMVPPPAATIRSDRQNRRSGPASWSSMTPRWSASWSARSWRRPATGCGPRPTAARPWPRSPTPRPIWWSPTSTCPTATASP